MSDEHPRVVETTDDEINERLKDESRMAIVAMILRPGVRSMMIAVEWRLFCPLDEKLNEDFEIVLKSWMGLPFAVVIVPLSYKEKIEEVAGEFNLKLVGAAFTVIDSGGAHQFPIMAGERLFNVENLPGSAIYQNDPSLFQSESDMLESLEVEEKAKARARNQ